MEWLLNPWVISIVLLAVVVGNLMVLKNTANVKAPKQSKTTSDIDRLTEIEKQNRQKIHRKEPTDPDNSGEDASSDE
ncbi:hypothetical protein ST37_11250 [Vibrio sp. qd031]|uniref:DUF2897 family protein n=1 Tax=Vibrio sp. qd031 TaxID=1603038 RepID=UPI000A103622|nr:DUF2897 family protein [Vibrio sp. qd031]ORT50438.1 hypothetical protein ST37_11250 [Vibrio sp. qd031]